MRREKAQENFVQTGIYGITAEALSKGRSNFDVVKAMLAGGIKFLQYREKNKSAREMYEQCLKLRQLTQAAKATFVIDDFVDLALAVDADGVHIGQTDLPPQVVRSLLGNDKIIGWSTHSEQDLEAASELVDVIDYIGVGPVFATKTKENAVPAGLAYVCHAQAKAKIPYVAIGGIHMGNIVDVLRCGARTIASVSAIVGAEDIAGEVRAMKRKVTSFDNL